MLANHGSVLSHVHAAESDDHAVRPHFHTGGHGAHEGHGGFDCLADHEHGTSSEHDSDAVYCMENDTLAPSGRVVSVEIAELHFITAILCISKSNGDCLSGPELIADRSILLSGGDFPIYLRTHSLRI